MIKSPPYAQGGGGGAVSSVNGQTGAVTLTAADVDALPSWPPIPQSPDIYPAVMGPPDDEFDSVNFDEPALDTTGDRFPGANPWTWINQGGATASIVDGQLVIVAPNSAGTQYRMVVQDLPAGPWRRRLKISGISGEGDQYIAAGLVVRNDTTGALLVHIAQNGQSWSVYQVYYTDPATYGGFANEGQPNTFVKAGAADVWAISFPIYMEVESDETDIIFRWSNSGAEGTYFELARDPIAAHVGAADQIGICINVQNSKPGAFAFDFFRDPD